MHDDDVMAWRGWSACVQRLPTNEAKVAVKSMYVETGNLFQSLYYRPSQGFTPVFLLHRHPVQLLRGASPDSRLQSRTALPSEEEVFIL